MDILCTERGATALQRCRTAAAPDYPDAVHDAPPLRLDPRMPYPQARLPLHAALADALKRRQPVRAAQARYLLAANLLASGAPLRHVQAEAEMAHALTRDAGCGRYHDLLALMLRMVRNLRGQQAGCIVPFGRLGGSPFDDGAGAPFDETRFERELACMPAHGDALRAARCYWLHKLQLRFHAGEYDEALAAARACAALLEAAHDDVIEARHAFYSGMAQAALADTAPGARRTAQLAALAACQHTLQRLALHGGANFGAMAVLLDAELARLRHATEAATRGYAQAAALAAEQGHAEIEALAFETAARLYRHGPFASLARAHWRQAHSRYRQWGALAKLRQLEEYLPALRLGDDAPSDHAGSTASTAATDYAAAIAHEVKQPLAAIVLHANAGLAWLAHDAPPLDKVRSALELAAAAGRSAGAVVRGMRQLAERAPPEAEMFIVDDAVRETLSWLHGRLGCERIALRARLHLGTQTLRANRAQLQQVLMNLCINAIEALAGVAGRRRMLTVRTRVLDGGALRLSVEDNGHGIAPGSAHAIFEPLYTTKRRGGGIGLALCRAIAGAHGGTLDYAPRQPHGSAFDFTLPPHQLPVN